jgi:GAF domain-containing protein
LLDKDERFAVLRESTGTVGAQLKARGHKLGVGSKSLIGWVTHNRQHRIALDVGEDPFHFKNPLLPDTRSELAIPLRVGDRLLGALDVQSTAPNAFGASDLQVIQTVADQLSIAIENALLFARTEASLQELSQLYQRMTNTSWRGLLRGKSTQKVYEASQNVPTAAGTAGLPLLVPLVLRGQTLGYIELHGRRPEEWSPEERAALNNVASQVASALESAALLEETQRRRLQEQVISDITQQMRASFDPAAVVQSGVRELGKALGATEVIVRLTPGARPAHRGSEEG